MTLVKTRPTEPPLALANASHLLPGPVCLSLSRVMMTATLSAPLPFPWAAPRKRAAETDQGVAERDATRERVSVENFMVEMVS